MKNRFFQFLLKGLLCSLTFFSFHNYVFGQVLYNADFSVEGEGFPDHTTSSPAAAAPATANGGSGAGVWTASYSATPSTDGTANEFSVNSSVMRIQDWGGTAKWQSASIDVSGVLTLDIAAAISELPGGGINAGSEFFEFYYALDGAAEVPTTTTSGAPPNYSVSSLDVSSANSIVVGFNFNINGAGDGWAISSFTVTSTLLPIELSSYTTYITNNDIELNWQTASELNNSHFTIDHTPTGRNFQPIGQVKGGRHQPRRKPIFLHP